MFWGFGCFNNLPWVFCFHGDVRNAEVIERSTARCVHGPWENSASRVKRSSRTLQGRRVKHTRPEEGNGSQFWSRRQNSCFKFSLKRDKSRKLADSCYKTQQNQLVLLGLQRHQSDVQVDWDQNQNITGERLQERHTNRNKAPTRSTFSP